MQTAMSSSLLMGAGLAGVGAGSLCLYAGSPHQRWLRAPWPRRPARWAGAALFALAWLALACAMDRMAATFTFITGSMLALTLLPYLGAWLHVHRAR